MGYARKGIEDLEDMFKKCDKKFVRYEEGALLFSMGRHAFADLAKKAGATYKVSKVVLVNVKIVEDYIEKNFRIKSEEK